MDYQLPADFIEDMGKLLGSELDAFLASYQVPSFHGLRFRNERYEKALLSAEELTLGHKVDWANYAYYYEETERPGTLALHEMGAYYIQEPSAMAPAAMLSPMPGERVLDLCAAPGGKSTELATYLNGEGLLVSNEIHPARAKILASNIERMGIKNSLVLNMDSAGLAQHFSSFFHKILVDAPCSGEGMFRKNPEAIAEWSRENVIICHERQKEILANAYTMLLAGGKLCYSTCTFAKEENEDIVDWVLQEYPDMKLLEAKRFWPHKEDGEGHFMALFEKEGTLNGYELSTHGATLLKNDLSMIEECLNGILSKDCFEELFSKENQKKRLITFGEQVYLVPKECPELKGLKVMRAGLHLGEKKKGRFEPAHALALSLCHEDVSNSFDMTKEQADGYLRGESVFLPADTSTKNGWCLMTYRKFPVGWAKISGGQAKNHYPKGLRKH